MDSHIEDENYIIDKFRNYSNFLFSQDFFENDSNYLDSFKEGSEMMAHIEKNRPHSNITFEDILMNNQPIFEFYKKNKK